MPHAKVNSQGQITIPKPVREALKIKSGDLVEVVVKNGKGMFMPTRLVAEVPAAKLTVKEQQSLSRVKKKIEAIQTDVINSKGLTKDEADVAAKVGLIAEDQKYWWLEEWQKGEREVERNYEKGDYVEYDNAEEFLKSLPS